MVTPWVPMIMWKRPQSILIISFALHDPLIFGRSSDHKDSDPTVLAYRRHQRLFADGLISGLPYESASSPTACISTAR